MRTVFDEGSREGKKEEVLERVQGKGDPAAQALCSALSALKVLFDFFCSRSDREVELLEFHSENRNLVRIPCRYSDAIL